MMQAFVAKRGPRAAAQQLLEAIAFVTGDADGSVQVEAFELCVMTQRFARHCARWSLPSAIGVRPRRSPRAVRPCTDFA